MSKFRFGWSVFWAYIGFSQFMLIWYANLPEETFYYLTRMQGPSASEFVPSFRSTVWCR